MPEKACTISTLKSCNLPVFSNEMLYLSKSKNGKTVMHMKIVQTLNMYNCIIFKTLAFKLKIKSNAVEILVRLISREKHFH